MIYLATYFDINYLDRGLVLHNSLIKTKCNFKLFILALDNRTYDFFKSNESVFTNITIIQLSEIFTYKTDLCFLQKDRSIVELYFTLSPVLPLFLLSKFKIPHICTLDADMYFFTSPQCYFDLLKKFDIILTPHKFSDSNKNKLIYGKYNVSFQIFNNNEKAIQFLDDWQKLCFDWCFDILDLENDRFADQLYLNRLAIKFAGSVYDIDDCVGGLAPWNISSFDLEFKNSKFLSNQKEIIFYHFHGFKFLSRNIISTSFSEYSIKYNKVLLYMLSEYWSNLKLFQYKFKLIPSTGLRYQNESNVLQKIIENHSIAFRINQKTFFFQYNKLPYPIRLIIFLFSKVL